ncbi:MAG: carbohydrate-binding domain-containing protein [Oscillospiraceae bacterium]|jgi:hypothetical protein|nr:carbohydrate-binding domain-containing protein [Oscillospiraceae bacterium]
MKKLALFMILALILTLAGCAAQAPNVPPQVNAPPTNAPSAMPTEPIAQSVSGDDSAPAVIIATNGEHTLTGAINGQVLVTAANVTLILDNATITCADASAILGDDGNGQKKLQELTVKLVGISSVTSGAKHGIQGKDNLTITGDGSLEVTAVKDGLHAGDTLNFESGTVNVLSSYEGVEAAYVNLIGGSLTTHASDDGVNAASDEEGVTPSVTISGGTHFIYSGSDGIDSNGTLTISGGSTAVLIYAPRDGQTFDADRPATVLPTLNLQGKFAAGDVIAVFAADGKSLCEITLDTAITAAAFTLPELVNGTAYSVTLNGAEFQSVTATTTVAAGMGAGFGGGQGGNRGDWSGEMPDWNGAVPPDGFAPPNGQNGGNFGGRGERGNAPIPPGNGTAPTIIT